MKILFDGIDKTNKKQIHSLELQMCSESEVLRLVYKKKKKKRKVKWISDQLSEVHCVWQKLSDADVNQ